MTDLTLAAQAAVYGALTGAGAPPAVAPVFEYVPEKTEPPMTILSRFTATPAGGKGDRFDQIEFEILSVVREPGREFLTPRLAAVRETIEGRRFASANGVEMSPPVFLSSDDELLEDGQTYLGTQRFSLFAQPAD